MHMEAHRAGAIQLAVRATVSLVSDLSESDARRCQPRQARISSIPSFLVFHPHIFIHSTGFTLLCDPVEYMCSPTLRSVCYRRRLRQLIQSTTLQVPSGHLTETHFRDFVMHCMRRCVSLIEPNSMDYHVLVWQQLRAVGEAEQTDGSTEG